MRLHLERQQPRRQELQRQRQAQWSQQQVATSSTNIKVGRKEDEPYNDNYSELLALYIDDWTQEQAVFVLKISITQ